MKFLCVTLCPLWLGFWFQLARLRILLRLSSQGTVSDPVSTQAVPVVSVNNVVKQFGRFAALRGVSAHFAAGRLFAVVGDNGAGKTTLLRTLAGLSKPTRGQVSVLGSSDHSNICHEIGYMAHPSLLYDEMSGMENLRYFAQLY